MTKNLAPESSNPNFLTAFYDLNVSPMSFDYFTFLALADLARRKHGKEFIHIVIVPNFGDGFLDWKGVDVGYDVSQKQWRVFNVIIQASWLVPSVKQLTLCNRREEGAEIYDKFSGAIYPDGHSMEKPVMGWDKGLTSWHAYQDEELQCLGASESAKKIMAKWLSVRAGDKKVVVLTFREASYFPARNTDLKEWGDFARSIKDQGYYPVIIRDAEKIAELPPPELEGLTEFPEAVFNMELRIALYELSYIAMFVSNGPSEIGFYNKEIPYLYFVTGNWLTERPTPFESQGIAYGQTPSFATAFQQWVWREVDAHVLEEEFKRLAAEIEEAKSDGTYDAKLGCQPENRVPLIELAEGFFRTGRFENAEMVCKAILSQDPEHGYAYLLMAKSQISRLEGDNIDPILKILDKAETLGADRILVQREVGRLLMNTQRWEEALLAYETLIAEDPNDLFSHLQKAIIFDELGQHQEAIDGYQLILDAGQIHPNILYRIVENLKAMGRFQEAAELGIKWHQLKDAMDGTSSET